MNDNVKNILAIAYMASSDEWVAGLEWYSRANHIASHIAEQYNKTTGIVAGVISAISPRNKWNTNVANAEALIKAHSLGIDPASVKVCSFNQNKKKAITILDGTPVEDVLTGNKTRAFFTNIVYPDFADGPVTVDGHAFSVFMGARVVLDKVPKISDKLYAEISDAYRFAAAEMDVLPHQMQAITWEVYRNLHGIR